MLIILFIYLLVNNHLNIASAIVLFNYRGRVFDNLMKNVGNLLEEVRGFNLSCNRVFALLGSKEFQKENFGCKHIDKINGNFEFKNVYYNTNTLHIHFFKPTTKIFVVGLRRWCS